MKENKEKTMTMIELFFSIWDKTKIQETVEESKTYRWSKINAEFDNTVVSPVSISFVTKILSLKPSFSVRIVKLYSLPGVRLENVAVSCLTFWT